MNWKPFITIVLAFGILIGDIWLCFYFFDKFAHHTWMAVPTVLTGLLVPILAALLLTLFNDEKPE